MTTNVYNLDTKYSAETKRDNRPAPGARGKSMAGRLDQAATCIISGLTTYAWSYCIWSLITL